MNKYLTAIFSFSAVMAVIGCASSPKVQDVSECRYGENESELIDNLGIGSEIIYFRIGNNDYHYRSYVVGGRGTGPVYGMLFKSNKLSVMAKETSLSFDECLELNDSESWDTCFSDSIRKMEEGRIDIATEEFSEGVAAESAAASEDAIGALLGAPVVVIFWPISTAVYIGSALNLKTQAECEKIPHTAISLFPTGSYELVLETLSKKHSDYVISENDSALDNQRIIARTWACGGSTGTALGPGRFRFHPKIEVRFGFTESSMNWLQIKLHPIWWKWGPAMKNESSEN